MSSSGRDTGGASPKKLSGSLHTAILRCSRVVERSRSQRLAAEVRWERRFNCCNCCQITVRNANNYCDILISTNTKVHKQGYSIYSQAGFVITDDQVWHIAERLT